MATKNKKKSAKPVAKKTTPKPKAAKAAKPAKKSPRSQRLPGMEDAAIETLEKMAHDYADVRDERIGFSLRESELKKDLLAEMKRQKREKYVHGRVEINIVHESENVKVKILKQSAEEPSHEVSDETPEPEDTEFPEAADEEVEVALQ